MDNIIRNKVIIRECTHKHIQLHIWDDREKVLFYLLFHDYRIFFQIILIPITLTHTLTFTLYFASSPLYFLFPFLLLLNKLVRDLYLVELTAHGFKEDNRKPKEKPNPNKISLS